MALMMAALMIKGIQPGPQVMTSNPELFWGLVASMWIGNLMLIVLNLPLIGMWIKLLSVPYKYLFPAIVVFCCIGLYTLNNDSFDVYVGAAFALIGYVLFKLGCEPAPLLLGYILGPMMEEKMRQALLISHGDWSTFVTRPLSLGLLMTAAILVVVVVGLPAIRRQREQAFKEE
jgi:TctA family transporter